ncbi:MAG: SUMF1/EgtB/PvdO family nonheme iron enzyme [Deltaproteobacteria bacterium]|nr:SUMF1/EgtB/PvdO family nonheme iron enzyme [Deltaproteobacteria bacterium]
MALLLCVFAYFLIGALRGNPAYDAALAASEAMIAARAAAVEAGAELEPVIQQFTEGEGERAAADGHVKAEAYAEAAESLQAATRWYQQAIPVANERKGSGVFTARKEAEAARAAAVEAGADSEEIEPFGRAERRAKQAEAAFAGARYAESADAYREAAKLYEKARVAAIELAGDVAKPSVIHLGSSPEEIQLAMLLCAYSGRPCHLEDFNNESYREIKLAPFAIDPHEVTNGQFQEFVKETGYLTTAEREGYSWIHTPEGSRKVEGYSWSAPQGPGSNILSQLDRPVVHVSASDSEAYCNWNDGRRLPTEDEWEFSARGPERRIFPWGDEWDPTRLSWQSTAMQAAPVGSFSAGATPDAADQPIYDMAGNVWEWTSTLQGAERVLKGGSFSESNPAYFRSAAQLTVAPHESHGDFGFRCVKGN